MNYLVMILMLCLGISLGLNVSHYLPGRKAVTGTPAETKAPETDEARARRKRFEDEQKAFEQLMNYNSDVAYGVKGME